MQRTWEAAGLWIDREDLGVAAYGRMSDDHVQSRLSRIPAGEKLPTIIYLHGCDGLYWGARSAFFQRLVKKGYALIAPDSFARAYRPSLCFSQNAWVDTIRYEEIRYAAEQVRNLAWVDQDNLFLMGHSEGGMYTASYAGNEYKARIAAGNTCSKGIRGSSPLMVLWSSQDKRKGRRDLCAGAEKTFIADGSTHWVLAYREAKNAVWEFLDKYATKPVTKFPYSADFEIVGKRVIDTDVGNKFVMYAAIKNIGERPYEVTSFRGYLCNDDSSSIDLVFEHINETMASGDAIQFEFPFSLTQSIWDKADEGYFGTLRMCDAKIDIYDNGVRNSIRFRE